MKNLSTSKFPPVWESPSRPPVRRGPRHRRKGNRGLSLCVSLRSSASLRKIRSRRQRLLKRKREMCQGKGARTRATKISRGTRRSGLFQFRIRLTPFYQSGPIETFRALHTSFFLSCFLPIFLFCFPKGRSFCCFIFERVPTFAQTNSGCFMKGRACSRSSEKFAHLSGRSRYSGRS